MTAPQPPGSGWQITAEEWDHQLQLLMDGQVNGHRHNRDAALQMNEARLGPRPPDAQPWRPAQDRLEEAMGRGLEPRQDGPELHAELLGQAALQLVRFGISHADLTEAIVTSLTFGERWPDAAVRTKAAQIAAEAASWTPEQLLEHYRAFLKADREKLKESGERHAELERLIRLRALEADQWARQQLRAAGRQPVQLVPATEVWDAPDLAWLVDRQIPQTGIGAIFGATGTWKSFLALHLQLCVRLGLGFLGWPVNRRGWCFYLLGEGQAGARRRVRAGVADLPAAYEPPAGLSYAMHPFPLGDPEATAEFIAAAKEAAGKEEVALVVLDAAADFYPPGANENSATDMNPVIAQAKRIAAELRCFVLLIAHSGWEGGHQRGTSRFGQAWDFEAEAARDDARPLCGWLRITKVKDDETGTAIPFHVVRLALDAANADVTSLAVRRGHPEGVQGAAVQEEDEERALKANEQRVWQDVIRYLHEHASREEPLAFRRIKQGVTGREQTIRQMLDHLVRQNLAELAPGRGGYPGYFLPEDEPPYTLLGGCGWRPWEPPEKRYWCLQDDGTEVAGDGRDDH